MGIGKKGSGNNQMYTNVSEVVKDAMLERKYTQEMLGRIFYDLGEDKDDKEKDKKIGAYAQSSIAERLRKADMKVGTLVKILDIIGCDLVIVDRNKQSKNEWKIRNISEDEFNAGKRPRAKKPTEAE